MFERSGQLSAASEPAAGLARVAMSRGDLSGASRHIERIIGALDDADLERTSFPSLIRLTCYRVLSAQHDDRADAVLADVAASLGATAQRIDDPEVRRAFLDEVPANKEVLAAAHAVHTPQAGQRP